MPRQQVRRVLFVEANEDGTVGGSHRVLYETVRRLDQSAWDPVVLFYEDNPFAERLRTEGVEVHLFAKRRARERTIHRERGKLRKAIEVISAIRYRARFLREQRIDIVHMNNSPSVGNDDWLPAAWMARVPCLASVMGDAEGPDGAVQAWLSRRFDLFLPVSHYLADAMERIGVPSSRIHPTLNGIDAEAFRARVDRSAEVVRETLGVAPGQMLLVMVGNIREWKGQHVVIEALGAMKPSIRQRIRVVFAGAESESGDGYGATLRDLASRLGVDSGLEFLGARDDVPDLMNAADVVVHASTTPEPFGLVLIEAMAVGKPVVASREGGPAEILTPECGATYDVQHPAELARILTELEADPTRRAQMGIAALNRVEERFTLRRQIDAVETAYRLVTAGRNGRRG